VSLLAFSAFGLVLTSLSPLVLLFSDFFSFRQESAAFFFAVRGSPFQSPRPSSLLSRVAMKLDAQVLRYLKRDDFRVLTGQH
jgi:hypothetical protein